MYDVNNMRKFINNNKPLVRVIVIVLCFFGCIMLIIPNIDGEIINYGKDDEQLDILITEEFYKTYYGMEQEVVEEMYKHPERYSQYYIDFNVKSSGTRIISNIKTSLSTQTDNMWLYPVLDRAEICLGAGIDFDGEVPIIIRTDGMTDEEIDRLIRSVGITITANSFPMVAKKTIYFNK